jgi:hypothetical protein
VRKSENSGKASSSIDNIPSNSELSEAIKEINSRLTNTVEKISKTLDSVDLELKEWSKNHNLLKDDIQAMKNEK